MTRYDHVKEILDSAVNGTAIGAHGPFWRNLTRDQFVAKSVFGKKLVALGDGASSNIIHALRGLVPFGMNMGTPGAIYDRMPAGGFPPMPNENIDFIEHWINDGCPEDPWPPAGAAAAIVKPQGAATSQQFNDYFRTLDNWSNFQRTTPVDDAINAFFGAMDNWFPLAKGTGSEQNWTNALANADTQNGVVLLASKQEETVSSFFGSPLDIAALGSAYELFGEAKLPLDPLRPNTPHRMDGASMWFFWLAFVEAALLAGRDAFFWHALNRALLLGTYHDGLFRQRFTVNGFTRDDAGRAAMRSQVAALTDAQLAAEGRKRFAESGIG